MQPVLPVFLVSCLDVLPDDSLFTPFFQALVSETPALPMLSSQLHLAMYPYHLPPITPQSTQELTFSVT